MMDQADKAMHAQIELLMARYKAPVQAYLTRRLQDGSHSEDLTQEVFSALWRCGQINHIDNIEGYIFQIAANLLKDRARMQRRRPLLVHDEAGIASEPVDDINPERIALGKESCNRAIAAVHALPERQRKVLMLSKFEHMPGKEIAAHLGISISLVEKDLRRALAYLREQLS
ncbi:MAG: RNA polymerase sigma factor [Sphingobium sp.]